MEKLDKIGTGNAKPLPQNTKLVVADELNKVIEKVNEVVDDNVEFTLQEGTAYTLALTDINKYIQLSNANPITLTVPPYVDVPMPIGTTITLEQTGAGTFTVTAGTGVTLHGNVLSAGQYTIVILVKTSINTWTCIGGTV